MGIYHSLRSRLRKHWLNCCCAYPAGVLRNRWGDGEWTRREYAAAAQNFSILKIKITGPAGGWLM